MRFLPSDDDAFLEIAEIMSGICTKYLPRYKSVP